MIHKYIHNTYVVYIYINTVHTSNDTLDSFQVLEYLLMMNLPIHFLKRRKR